MKADTTATPLPKRVKNLTGIRRGLLVITSYAGKGIGTSRHARWNAQCDCGKTHVVGGAAFILGNHKSCGCLLFEAGKQNATHGMSGTPEYQAWLSARKRTRDPNCPEYYRYGGATPPITMSDELYDSFELWNGELGPRTTLDHSVDRRDNNRGYERGNLKWSTAQEQALNRKTNRYLEFRNVRKTWSEWDREYGFPKGTTKNRVKLGWSAEKIFSTPVRTKTKTPPV